MRIGILSRTGPCFPYVISIGLSGMLSDLNVSNEIIGGSIPFLMRLLPLKKQPKRWHNNLSFRIRNKILFFARDRKMIRRLRQYDALIISECYANAFWKNFFAVEELRRHFQGPILSYTEAPLDAAPQNRRRELDTDDYDESRFDFNLFVSNRMEIPVALQPNQAAIGMNVINPDLFPEPRDRFVALLDFDQPGYEGFRQQQIRVLQKLGVETVYLKGRYPVEEIRKRYRSAAIFFLSFPETIGLPIAECLACGTMVAIPDVSWPMAWQEEAETAGRSEATLPDCFMLYRSEEELEQKLETFIRNYNPSTTPLTVQDHFAKHYDRYARGNRPALKGILNQLK